MAWNTGTLHTSERHALFQGVVGSTTRQGSHQRIWAKRMEGRLVPIGMAFVALTAISTSSTAITRGIASRTRSAKGATLLAGRNKIAASGSVLLRGHTTLYSSLDATQNLGANQKEARHENQALETQAERTNTELAAKSGTGGCYQRMSQEHFSMHGREIGNLTKQNQQLFGQRTRIYFECSRANEDLAQLRSECANLRAEKKIWEHKAIQSFFLAVLSRTICLDDPDFISCSNEVLGVDHAKQDKLIQLLSDDSVEVLSAALFALGTNIEDSPSFGPGFMGRTTLVEATKRPPCDRRRHNYGNMFAMHLSVFARRLGIVLVRRDEAEVQRSRKKELERPACWEQTDVVRNTIRRMSSFANELKLLANGVAFLSADAAHHTAFVDVPPKADSDSSRPLPPSLNLVRYASPYLDSTILVAGGYGFRSAPPSCALPLTPLLIARHLRPLWLGISYRRWWDGTPGLDGAITWRRDFDGRHQRASNMLSIGFSWEVERMTGRGLIHGIKGTNRRNILNEVDRLPTERQYAKEKGREGHTPGTE
ncbi:hypothetical protein DFH07DRAFT_768867 [Mycena maculata]|uniref:Uncharacterized protein n=1 Tax=Mycena maculata TaxID=230809 RepID=A0AAD7NNX6_9AGAR|nr:hypothetical protein DFH07DRAFT_768867 [Mycena maculata]